MPSWLYYLGSDWKGRRPPLRGSSPWCSAAGRTSRRWLGPATTLIREDVQAGVYKVPITWYSSPFPFIKSWFSSQKFPSPSPFPFLLCFPKASILYGIWYYFPFPLFHVIFFLTAMIFPSPLHNLIFFPTRLDKLHTPLRTGEIENFSGGHKLPRYHLPAAEWELFITKIYFMIC